jgi:putative ABC transport system permease protein
MLNAGNQLIRVWGGQTSMKYRGLAEGRWIRFKEEDAILLKQNIPQIKEVSPSYGRYVRLRNGERTASTFLEAVYPNFEFLRTFYPKAKGRFLNERDLQHKRRVIFLGTEVAEEVFGEVDPIGLTVELDGVPFTVVGIMQKKLQLGMNEGPDDRRAIIPFTTFESLYYHRYLRMISVQPEKLADTQHIRDRIYQVLGRKLRFNPEDENALALWDMVTDLKEMDSVFVGIKIFLGVIGGLTLLVAGVGVANIMYVVVKERTREIGIKKAVGAKSRHIVFQFVLESVLIAIIGGALGIFFSWGIVGLFGLMPQENMSIAYLGIPEISQGVLFTTIFILGLIGIVAGVFPAYRAARLDPVESLRYE